MTTPRHIWFEHGSFFVGSLGYIHSSQDGETWRSSRLQEHAVPGASFSAPQSLQGFAYGNGRYIAVGGNWLVAAADSISYVSTNGMDWTLHPLKSDYVLTSVAFGNGIFAPESASWIHPPPPRLRFLLLIQGRTQNAESN